VDFKHIGGIHDWLVQDKAGHTGMYRLYIYVRFDEITIVPLLPRGIGRSPSFLYLTRSKKIQRRSTEAEVQLSRVAYETVSARNGWSPARKRIGPGLRGCMTTAR
jgi:hypothetical protein